MDDNIKYLQHQSDRNRADAAAARQQAQTMRDTTAQYDPDTQQGDIDYHYQQAEIFDRRAQELEDAADAMDSKQAEVQGRIDDLKAERERINRETVDRTLAIDKELASLQGSMTI